MAKRTPDHFTYIEHDQQKIPIALYLEHRRNVRVSIGTDAVHLRLPFNLDNQEFHEKLDWAEKWLIQRLIKNPDLLNKFEFIRLQNKDRLQILGDTWIIHISRSTNKTAAANMSQNDVFIKLPETFTEEDDSRAYDYLINKLLCQRYQHWIGSEVDRLNDQYFGLHIASVQLKNTKSTWGTCSYDGHISLSVNLLFCPQQVREYVIVHELAHLLEPNHSDRFWSIVHKALPRFEEMEKWLTENGTHINFMKGLRSKGSIPQATIDWKSLVGDPIAPTSPTSSDTDIPSDTNSDADSTPTKPLAHSPTPKIGVQLSLFD